MFKTDGVKRADISCRIRIACTQLEFETMKEHALETMTDSQLPELWFGDWEQIIGRKAELLAGNHRVEALKELLRWSASDEREWWWMADIYNQGTYLPVHPDHSITKCKRQSTCFPSHETTSKPPGLHTG